MKKNLKTILTVLMSLALLPLPARERTGSFIAKEQSDAVAERIPDTPVTEPAATKSSASRYAGIQGGMPLGTSAMSSFGGLDDSHST